MPSIENLIGLIKRAQIVIGVDSGIAHLSGFLDKKTVVLWGPSNYNKSHPLGKNVLCVNLNRVCAPCYGPDLNSSAEDAIRKCGFNIACMNNISVEMVLKNYLVYKNWG